MLPLRWRQHLPEWMKPWPFSKIWRAWPSVQRAFPGTADNALLTVAGPVATMERKHPRR
jgi:hypothetical protein